MIIDSNMTKISNIKALSSYLFSIIHKINNIAAIHNNIFPNCTSKDLLQSHSTNNSCDWKPTFNCRSECIKLDIPDNQLYINSWYQVLRFHKDKCRKHLCSNLNNKETTFLFEKECCLHLQNSPIRIC